MPWSSTQARCQIERRAACRFISLSARMKPWPWRSPKACRRRQAHLGVAEAHGDLAGLGLDVVTAGQQLVGADVVVQIGRERKDVHAVLAAPWPAGIKITSLGDAVADEPTAAPVGRSTRYRS